MGGFGASMLLQKKIGNDNARKCILKESWHGSFVSMKVDGETFWSSQQSSQLVGTG